MKLPKNLKTLKDLGDPSLKDFIPQFSVECVILGFERDCLKVLLWRMEGSCSWMLPWGLVHKDEDVDDAASNVLETRTSLKNIYLQQFYLFGKKNRRDERISDKIIALIKPEDAENHWFTKRFVSIGYYALVQHERVQIMEEEGEELAWFEVENLPDMYVNHDEVIQIAMRSIRNDIGYVPIGYEMLPKKFTMPELRAIYERILGKELDRRNFQRKMLSSGLIIPLNETRRAGAHKSPHLYSFHKEKYEKLKKEGAQLIQIAL